MAKMNGVNYGMDKPSGTNSKRMDPKSFARNNLSMGGVNGHAGGTESFTHKPGLSKGQMGQGKHRHDKR
jgi:hypothetical protein